VRRIAAKTAASGIVINGFAHLAAPGRRSDIETAVQVLANLVEHLEKRGAPVHLMPFGWNKRWQADVLDGEWEQRMVHLPESAGSDHRLLEKNTLR
jgi:hypothetical protein